MKLGNDFSFKDLEIYRYTKIQKVIKDYKTMPDYSKGKIYKILNNIDDEVYVGSTIETLGRRMGKHRDAMKKQQQTKLYEHMNELGVENFYIELIENFPCNDIYELRAREGYFIREIGTLNKRVEGRTTKEYHKQYYEEHKEELKQYREEHKEHINEKNTCNICGCQVNRRNLSRHQKSNKCNLIADCIISI